MAETIDYIAAFAAVAGAVAATLVVPEVRCWALHDSCPIKANANTSIAVGSAIAAQLNVVSDFYRALGRGDGAAASNLVMPAQRQPGSFGNAAGMTAFFGGFQKRLELQSVTSAGNDRVSAQYYYVGPSGKACQGVADVALMSSAGTWLISHINASC